MDYFWQGPEWIFRDIWVGRDITGNIFWNQDKKYETRPDKDFFPHDSLSKERFLQFLPVQVYSCWNAIVLMKAEPLVKDGIKFRMSQGFECGNSECQLIKKDFYMKGWDRTVMVPSVRVTYSAEEYNRIQNLTWLSGRILKSDKEKEFIPWRPGPSQVSCYPIDQVKFLSFSLVLFLIFFFVLFYFFVYLNK